jgi:hypothetical protein
MGKPAAGDIGLCAKFVWGSMVDFQKIGCNFCAIARNAAKCKYVVY